MGIRDGHLLGLGAPAAQRLAEDVVQIQHAHLGARHAGDLEGRQGTRAALADLKLDFLIVQLAFAQHLAELLPRIGRGALADQRVQHAVFGRQLSLGFDGLAQPRACHADRNLDQVADDLLDVAPDIADLGELGGLDLEERRLGQFRQAARDLGLAHARGADHQDVLGQNLFAQFGRKLLPAPAVAQRDGDGALGVGLADNETVEFGDDLTRRKGSGHRLSRVTLRLVKTQISAAMFSALRAMASASRPGWSIKARPAASA